MRPAHTLQQRAWQARSGSVLDLLYRFCYFFLSDPSGLRPVRDDDIAAFEQLMNEEKER